MSVLDDICFQMHGQSEGADMKLLEVRKMELNSVHPKPDHPELWPLRLVSCVREPL